MVFLVIGHHWSTWIISGIIKPKDILAIEILVLSSSLSIKSISDMIGLSVRTIKWYMHHAFTLLGVEGIKDRKIRRHAAWGKIPDTLKANIRRKYDVRI